MKVVVFAPFFPPDPTGSSVFAGQQVRELMRLGHKVLVVTNQVGKQVPNDPEVNDSRQIVIRLRSFRINLRKVTWNYGIPVSSFGFVKKSFLKQLRLFDPDFVIIHSTLFDLSLLALRWASKNNKKAVIVSHTALWHDNRIVNVAMKAYGRSVLRRFIENANAQIVCVDKWTLENTLKVVGPLTEIHAIPASVELGKMNNGDAIKIRLRHDLGNCRIVLSLGHVIPLRDRINLTRALPLLITRYPDLKVVVVGMVNHTKFLEEASNLGVLEHIVLAGPVPHSDIKDYLAASDVEAHDLNGTGLGITSVEAMDAGVPIVAWATDDNYPRFSLRSYGSSGFIDDGKPETIAKMIIRILDDEEYRESVICSQRELVSDIFSVVAVTRQYLEILKS
jgi:1,2-diacylglycerol 3-alpha-glucosyltransferase